MRQWFENLRSTGPAYGYFFEPSMSILVVQSSNLMMVNDLFLNLGIKMVIGSWFLGVGDQPLVANFDSEKVAIWCLCVQMSPYLSHRHLLHPCPGLCSLNGIMVNVSFLFAPLQHAINSLFYPALFEAAMSEQELEPFPPYMFWESWDG